MASTVSRSERAQELTEIGLELEGDQDYRGALAAYRGARALLPDSEMLAKRIETIQAFLEEERAAAGAAPEDRTLSGEPADGWDGGGLPLEEAANRTEAGPGGNRTAPAAVDQSAWDRVEQQAGAEPVSREPSA